MAYLRRPSVWYESWMNGTSQEAATSIRKSVAKELRSAIKDRDYDSQTLEEVNLILDHEYLCRRLQDSSKLKSNFESAIGLVAVGDLVDDLSSCLVQFINASSHAERELQCRALLSAFALLQLHGVMFQQNQSHAKWQEQLKRRFQDLVWLPGDNTGFSPEVFHKAQCSYLLSLGAAHAQRFVRAEPRSTAGVAIAMDIMQLSIIAVTTALGSGCAALGPSLQDLDSNLTRLLHSPDNGYQDLFELQGLTRIAGALQFYSRIGSQSAQCHSADDDLDVRALECSEHVATVVLRQILRILTENERFEIEVRPPSKFRDQLLALLNRGPAKLDKYNYFYGLLDCASQLAGIVDPSRYPNCFRSRMKAIIIRSCDASLRWKAMEVLLSHPKSRLQQSQFILDQTDQKDMPSNVSVRKQLQSEISVISECFRGDGNSVSIASQLPPEIETMCPGDWIEEPIPTSNLSPQTHISRIPLPRGPMYRRMRVSTAGFSTGCSYVYFLNEEMILIYSLSDQEGKLGEKPVFQKRVKQVKYYAATLSEEFIIILLAEGQNRAMHVFRYNGEMVGSESFEIEANGDQWNASDLVAIHGTGNRTWIAVGGCTKQDGSMTGSIKMFCIDDIGGQARLMRHSASFHRPKPNPLALDLLRTLDFSPDGKRLVCATNKNRVLVWRLSNNARPFGAPFVIERHMRGDIKGGKISSATLFHSPSSRPYLLCTTMPSLERAVNQGEWSFISPVGSGPIQVHDRLVRDLTWLKRSGPILMGAIAPQARAIALVRADSNDRGRLMIMPLAAEDGGGFSGLDPILLEEGVMKIRDSGRRLISPAAIRFHSTAAGFTLIAVDVEGKIIRNHIAG